MEPITIKHNREWSSFDAIELGRNEKENPKL